MADFQEFWNNDYQKWVNSCRKTDPNDDIDGDYLPNTFEERSGRYNKNQYLTPNNDRPSTNKIIRGDEDDRACHETKEVRGDHTKDWANPGYQHLGKENPND